MRLNEFQKNFKNTMFQPLNKVDTSTPIFEKTLVQDHIPLNERLKVYHNNVIGSLTKNILATYPLLEALVGEAFLKDLARTFIIQNPPHSACLHYYGEEFDSFVKGHKSTKNMPYLADVATLEWALHKAYYAEDDMPMSEENLSSVTPESLADTQINLRHCVSLVESPYPLQSIRELCLNKIDKTPDMDKDHNSKLMIWRQKLEVNILTLKDDEFTMLKHVNNGKALGQALEETLNNFPSFDLGNFLQKNIALETFTALPANT